MKKYLFPVTLLLVAVLMTGCFGSVSQPEATPTPAPNGALPGTTLMPGAAGATMTPAQSPAPYDWATQASMVEGRVAMFSEIQSCKIVVCEDTALVGVQFADAYRGEMTQRIRDMIAGEVMAVDQSIQVVAVTADANDVQKINELSNQVQSGQQPADLKQQVDQIARNTTTLR